MTSLYIANKDHTLSYAGNNLFEPMQAIKPYDSAKLLVRRGEDLHKNKMWQHITRINHTINMAANEFFNDLGSSYTLLPLTTKMISSPGALYGKEKLDYTVDTVPVKLKWFEQGNVFLAESSQIYLEMSLTIPNTKSVYAIYNSFRKEPSDITHLAEFHHIEYEGKVTQKENQKIFIDLTAKVIDKLLKNNAEDLAFFLKEEDIKYLKSFAEKKTVVEMEFADVLKLLRKTTGEARYDKFTMQNFGSWEEVKVSGEVQNMLMVREFPLYEIAFYHAPLRSKEGRKVGENADLIWPSYREFIGSGHRVRSLEELQTKAEKFNLPVKDYEPYLQTRRLPDYEETSGFGFGWERFLQGLLKLPYIQLTVPFPRVDSTTKP